MHVRGFAGVVAAITLCLLSTLANAAHNVADYPLRVHLFESMERSTFVGGQLDHQEGDGKGNLFEQGHPRGFDFHFNCGDKLRMTDGFETYPAKWKKKDAELEILTPVLGKPGATHTCQLKVLMKLDTVYTAVHTAKGNSILVIPAIRYKIWMETYQYDPEHDKNTPVRPSNGQAASGSVAGPVGP